jgi:hypothetical protein
MGCEVDVRIKRWQVVLDVVVLVSGLQHRWEVFGVEVLTAE